MTETEKFGTERLVARPWQIEDRSLAMELWGDPAVTALIASRGKLTNTQVGEKLRAEIEGACQDAASEKLSHVPRAVYLGFGRGDVFGGSSTASSQEPEILPS
jgi:hypothetical protein